MERLPTGRRARVPWPALVAVVACALLIAVPAAASVDAVTTAKASLPVPAHGMALAWTGEVAYLFGGVTESGTRLDTIYRYDPAAGSFTRMQAILPGGLTAAGATWADGKAYLVGGFEGDSRGRALLRYDPVLDEVVVADIIPGAAISHASVVWTGDEVLILGGDDGAASHQRIYRYDPLTGDLYQARADLPEARWRAAAAWDHATGVAYMFGGSTPQGASDAILRYDPLFDVVTVLDVRLPSPRQDATAVWTGDDILVVGGFSAGALRDVIRFEADAARVVDTGLRLPAARAAMVGYWDDEAGATLLGGTDGINPSDDLYRITGAQHTTTSQDAGGDVDEPGEARGDNGGTGSNGGGSQGGSGASQERVFSNATTVEYLTARFSYERDTDEPLLVRFQDASFATDDTVIEQFRWAFGDGAESRERNPHHLYAGPGRFVVTLTIVDETGLEAATAERVPVGARPQADEGGIPDTWFIVGTIALVGSAAALFSFRNRY